MAQRMDYDSATPAGVEALNGVYDYIMHSGLPKALSVAGLDPPPPSWARSPTTDKQRELLKLAFLDQMSLYEAKCRIAFKFNQSATQDLVLEHAKHREAA